MYARPVTDFLLQGAHLCVCVTRIVIFREVRGVIQSRKPTPIEQIILELGVHPCTGHLTCARLLHLELQHREESAVQHKAPYFYPVIYWNMRAFTGVILALFILLQSPTHIKEHHRA